MGNLFHFENKKISYFLIFLSIIFFISFRFYNIDLIWSGRFSPPEPDDSFGYITSIRLIGDSGSYLYNLKYILSSYKTDHLVFAPWSSNLAIMKIIFNISYTDIYKINFYFGIIFLSIVLLYFSYIIEKDSLFIILNIIFLSFYNGSGEYHGFFWIVPSFYSLIFSLLLISLLYQNNLFNISKIFWFYISIVSFVLISIHPLGKFSFLCIIFSLFFFILFKKILFKQTIFKEFKNIIIISIIGIFFIFLYEIFPILNGMQNYTYPNIINIFQYTNSISLMYNLYLILIINNPIYIILLIIGFIAILIKKNYILLFIYTSYFIFTFIACLFNTVGFRMLAYLWPITYVIISYGFYSILKEFLSSLKKLLISENKIKLINFFKKESTNRNYTIMILIILFLLSTNYYFPFIKDNYYSSIKLNTYFNERMKDWPISSSLIKYLNNNTKPQDLILFTDSNAFYTVTSQGLLDRETAFSDWDWEGKYNNISNKINGSLLITTNDNYKNYITNRNIEKETESLSKYFKNKIIFEYIKNFGVIDVYKISVKKSNVTNLFSYVKYNPIKIVDEFQTLFWKHTNYITLLNDFQNKTSDNSSLKINILQNNFNDNDFIYHIYDTNKNWTKYNILCFDWYGKNSKKSIEILIYAPNINDRFIYTFKDNFEGWHEYKIKFDDFKIVIGNPSWGNIKEIYYRFNIDSPYKLTFNIDNLYIDYDPLKDVSITNLNSENILYVIPMIIIYIVIGLFWCYFIFKSKNMIFDLANSFAITFSLLFIISFTINIFLNINITKNVIYIIMICLIALPMLFNLFKNKYEERKK